MKRSFSLIELLFVMAIFGVLITIGLYSFKLGTLRNDTNYLMMKILETKYQGILYDKLGLIQANAIGCIDLDEKNLKNMAKQENYVIKSTIRNFVSTLCFDSFGRAHIDDNRTLLNSLVTQKRDILQLQDHNHNAIISVLPQTGYVIIKNN